MKVLAIFLFLLLNISVFGQFKEYDKLDKLFNEKQYEKCIDLALKYSKKEPKELMPVLYASRANFELFKLADGKTKLIRLKQGLKYANKIERFDKKKEANEKYADFMNELHKETLEFAGSIYYGDKKQKSTSKSLFDYVAKIYNDTTPQFYDFHPELRKKTSTTVGLNTQLEDVNKTDKNGQKQGFWKKVYPNGAVAYEVYFKDGKPIGTHKRYHENSKLMAELKFDEKGEWADAELFNDKAELVAKGKYQNQKRQGVWDFYMEKVKIAQETYDAGKKNGVSKTFYKNGKVSEEKNWENDIENGVWRQYFLDGETKLETRVENGKRNSVYYTFHPNGQFEIKGRYKNDHMDGEWIYYDTKGVEIYRVTYEEGKSDQRNELNEKQNEILKKLDQNKGRLKDPANFINNPNEYLKNSGLK